jgi:hypothetical protein
MMSIVIFPIKYNQLVCRLSPVAHPLMSIVVFLHSRGNVIIISFLFCLSKKGTKKDIPGQGLAARLRRASNCARGKCGCVE